MLSLTIFREFHLLKTY